MLDCISRFGFTMQELSFTANRFKAKQSPLTDEHPTPTDVPQKQGISCKDNILFDSEYYTLSNEYKSIPKLDEFETILDLKAVSPLVSVLTTNSRILVYNHESCSSVTHTFEIPYSPNSYNLMPLSAIISNPLNALKPDLVVIDPISGEFQFFESIKLVPSLSVLQNVVKDRITLYNAEFLTGVQLFQENSILVTTSQKRVIEVTFKDQLGNISIKLNQVYNNRPLISSILSKTHSISEIENSSHIVSIKTYDASPIMKSIIVLESTGRVVFINHLKGSSSFNLVAQHDMELILSNVGLRFLDFEFLKNSKIGVFLTIDLKENNLISNVFYFENSHSVPNMISNKSVPCLSLDEEIIDPKVFSFNLEKTLLVKNDKKLIIFDPNFENLASPWVEVLALNRSLIIYSAEKLPGLNDKLFLATNEGLLTFSFKESGKSGDINGFLKEHINQYLQYNKSDGPLIFDLKETSLAIATTNIRDVLSEIYDELLENKSNASGFRSFADSNLERRVFLVKNLTAYTQRNYDIQNDEVLRTKILKSCELLALAKNFLHLNTNYSLINDSDMLDHLKIGVPLTDYLQNNTKNVLTLISKYVNYILNSGTENQVIQLSSLLKELFINSIIKLDDDVKQLLGGSSLSSVFVDHFELINNVNVITRKIYNLASETTDENVLAGYNQTLIGLSCFLYYSVNEIVEYLSTRGGSALVLFDELLTKEKDKWVHVFVVMKKQRDILPLVNKYKDFAGLSALLESMREDIQTLFESEEISEIEFANMATDVEIEFDRYFEYYGYEFAEALFSYYKQNHKVNIMLQNFDKHSVHLERFLESDLSNYSFGWIHDIMNHKVGNVSNKMIEVALEYSTSLREKKFQSSLGKLATVLQMNNSSEQNSNNLMDCYNANLSIADVQECIYYCMQELGMFSNSHALDALIDSPYIRSNNFNEFRERLKEIYFKLERKGSLDILEIVDFVSLGCFQPNILTNEVPKNGGCDSTGRIVLEIYCKTLHLLKTLTNCGNISLIVGSLSMSVLLKLFLKRIFMNRDYVPLEQIVLELEKESLNISFNDHSLMLSEDEIYTLQRRSNSQIKDYEKENRVSIS